MTDQDPMLARYYSRVLEIDIRWAAFMDRRPDLVIKNYAHAFLAGQRSFHLGPHYLRGANKALGRNEQN